MTSDSSELNGVEQPEATVGSPAAGAEAAALAQDERDFMSQALTTAVKPAPTQKQFLLELLSAQAVLLLVCLSCTCLLLWGDLGLSNSKNMSDALRDYNELAILRVPFLAWTFPLLGIASVAVGPRATLNGRWLSMATWIFVCFVGMSALFCYGGQMIPFVGPAGPKAMNMMFHKGLFLVPFLANAGLSAIVFLLRRMSLYQAEDNKAAGLGLALSAAILVITRFCF